MRFEKLNDCFIILQFAFLVSLIIFNKKYIIKTCPWCKEEFEVYSSKKTTYCSTDCSNKANIQKRMESEYNEFMQDMQNGIILGEQDLVC